MSSNDALGFPTNKKLMLWDDGTWCLVKCLHKIDYCGFICVLTLPKDAVCGF